MDYNSIFNQILMLFILMIVGYVARKINIFDDKVNKGFSDIILKITLPAMIIGSMVGNNDPNLAEQFGKILLISLSVYAITFILAIILPRLIKSRPFEKGIFEFAIMFSNVGFMGYPVTAAVFGEEGVFYTAIFNLPFNLLVFTIGLIFLSSKQGQKTKINPKLLINPGVIAVLIGFIIFSLKIPLPKAITGSLDLLGSVTTPLSMIVIGGLLAKVSINKIFSNYRVYLISIFRLFLVPMIVYFTLRNFVDGVYLLGVPVLLSSMPVAANSAILAEEYKGNAELASQTVFISTLFSIISIPLITMFFIA
ncbi:AEC family transporter [Geotoga petraea]|uniref:AEC family transporter n=1 Tax=Geotoga petraea TaxID=28234 RepID=A0A4Z0VXE7_9BACT|nr:AEC family transporter [Geotoga petraea]TGG88681.1 AEC family transporter [Geotoga petraea]